MEKIAAADPAVEVVDTENKLSTCYGANVTCILASRYGFVKNI